MMDACPGPGRQGSPSALALRPPDIQHAGGPPWRPPPQDLLRKGEVHVWRAALDSRASRILTLEEILDQAERDRAQRYFRTEDRRRFIAARGILRRILASYLGLEPQRIQFDTDRWGKPRLADAAAAGRLRFNLSHSHELALYAISRDREVGIDLERVRADFEWEPAAERLLSSAQVEALGRVPTHMRPEAFFTLWTRMEALLKARGQGLGSSFETQVSLPWPVCDLSPGPGYAAAFAVEGRIGRVKLWEWPDFPGQG